MLSLIVGRRVCPRCKNESVGYINQKTGAVINFSTWSEAIRFIRESPVVRTRRIHISCASIPAESRKLLNRLSIKDLEITINLPACQATCEYADLKTGKPKPIS